MRNRNRHNVFLILLLKIFLLSVVAQAQQRPKIGLTLSGGGAKGLAHIGILRALDSAGLKIDYITGTSMGSIIGSLYAIGYNSYELEKISRKLNWDILLSNSSSLNYIIPEEKDEYDKYAIELPWVNHKFRLPTGFFESEELWLKFSELYFPVYHIKNFNQFPIPFKCIATDISNGDAVVLDSGEIVKAIRASMAIPSVFTMVDYNGKKLVDGGVVRNFPVKDVKEMGANIVIGSSVDEGLLPKEKINNALQVLLQVAFFKEAKDQEKEIKLCDYYILIPMQNYSTASFSNGNEIIDLGIEEGKKYYPAFKKLADSLNAIYGQPATDKAAISSKKDSVFITQIEINGLSKTTSSFFEHGMRFYTNQYYAPKQLTKMVRKIFGTRYYNRLLYSLQPLSHDSAKIVFEVDENPKTFAKLGLHYNRLTGIGLLANITARNFITPGSRSLFTINLGDAIRLRAEHVQYFGRSKAFSISLLPYYEFIDLPTFTNFVQDAQYRQTFFKTEAKVQYSNKIAFLGGMGIRYEYLKLNPNLLTTFQIKGTNDFISYFAFADVNTLDRKNFPKKGVNIHAEFNRITNQTPKVKILLDGREIIDLDSIGIAFNNYSRFFFNAETYLPITKKLTFSTLTQGGINFSYNQAIVNDFIVGGMTRLFRNQIVFAGLIEGQLFTPSVLALQLGVRYELSSGIYFSLRSNGLINNFISSNNSFQRPGFLSGHAATISISTPLGPLEVSAMYSEQTQKLKSYINLGIAF